MFSFFKKNLVCETDDSKTKKIAELEESVKQARERYWNLSARIAELENINRSLNERLTDSIRHAQNVSAERDEILDDLWKLKEKSDKPIKAQEMTAKLLVAILDETNTSGVLYQLQSECNEIERLVYEQGFLKYGMIAVINRLDPSIDLEYLKKEWK